MLFLIGGKGMNWGLLIVADDRGFRERVTSGVDWSAGGYRVFSVESDRALKIVQNEVVDILVQDVGLAGKKDLQVAQQAKAFRENLKIIITASHPEFELAQAAIRLGVEDYILKPFHCKHLLTAVDKTKVKLEAKQRHRQEEKTAGQPNPGLGSGNLAELFDLLRNPEFFLSEGGRSMHRRLAESLRSATVFSLQRQIRSLQHVLESYAPDLTKTFLFLNCVVGTSLAVAEKRGLDLKKMIDSGFNQMSLSSPGDLDDLKQWLETFLLEVYSQINSDFKNDSEQLIKSVKEYVDLNYRHGVTLRGLAAQANMSPSQLSKLFSTSVGESFSSYLNRLRREKAQEMLKTTNQRVYEIAEHLGFNSAYYFSSWFKQVVGSSPTEYRGNHRKYPRRWK